MRGAIVWAILSAVILAAFLWLSPLFGRLGEPTPPYALKPGKAVPPVAVAEREPTKPRPVSTKGTAPPSEEPEPSKLVLETEDRVLTLTNRTRQKKGLPDLRAEDTLRRLARSHSRDMVNRHFFDHVNPDGLSPADRLARKHRRLIGFGGENIWTWSGEAPKDTEHLAEKIVSEWLASPENRANILKPEYTHLGVGIWVKDQEIRATQVFVRAQAHTITDVPATVKRGEKLIMRTGPGGPIQFDLFSPARGLIVAGPFPMRGEKDAGLNVALGRYKVRFYFPHSGAGFIIYEGPQIEVIP